MFVQLCVCLALLASVGSALLVSVGSAQNTLIDVAVRLGATTCVSYLNATGLISAFDNTGK